MSTHFKNIDEELYDRILWILSDSCEEYQHLYLQSASVIATCAEVSPCRANKIVNLN